MTEPRHSAGAAVAAGSSVRPARHASEFAPHASLGAGIGDQPPSSAPRFANLLRAEFHRLWVRRLVRALLVLLVLGYAAGIVLLWVKHSQVDAADRAQATRTANSYLAQAVAGRAECAQGKSADQANQDCGPVPSAADGYDPQYYLKNQPLRTHTVIDTTVALGVGVGAIGFVVAATFIGAEWSSENLVAWLFWEPRRLRLLGAKLLALLAVMLAVSLLVQLSWAVVARVLLSHRGIEPGAGEPHFWSQLLGVQTRAGLIVVATVVLGFAVAQLLRGTTAAFGVAFVYFAVIENAVRVLATHDQQYLFSTGLVAWARHKGLDFHEFEFDRRTGQGVDHLVHVSSGRGLLTTAIYVGVPLLVATAAFRRRDIT